MANNDNSSGSDSDKHAVKLTATYNDGSTEDFDTFIAAVAHGLMLAGKDNDSNTILYTAGKEFYTQGIAHIGATPDVCAGLIRCMMTLIHSLIDNASPETATNLLAALLSMSSEKTIGYNVHKSVNLNQG